MNSLFAVIPEIFNVCLVCIVFWLIFSVMGVQFFGGRFYKCVDENGEKLAASIVTDKTKCLSMNYKWRNSKINFDNSFAGFIALFQVVCCIPALWLCCHHYINRKFTESMIKMWWNVLLFNVGNIWRMDGNHGRCSWRHWGLYCRRRVFPYFILA